MGKPKTQIVSDIDSKFITNGNIRAVDTNAVLKDILDCNELNTPTDLTQINNRLNGVEFINDEQNNRLTVLENAAGSTIQRIDFRSDVSLFDLSNNAKMMYSIRGIAGQFINVMLHIKILESNTNSYSFVHGEADLTQILKSIKRDLTPLEMDFLVKVKSEAEQSITGKRFKIANLIFNEFKGKFTIIIEPHDLQDVLQVGDIIFTTITLHTPTIDVVQINNKITKNTVKPL